MAAAGQPAPAHRAAVSAARSAAAALREDTHGFVEYGIERTTTLALDMAELEEDEAIIGRVEDLMCELLSVEKRRHLFCSAVKDMKQQAKTHTTEDLTKMLEERVESMDSVLATFNPRQDQRFLNIRRNIAAMNPQVEENAQEGDLQEDVVFTQAEKIIKCPLTMELMQRPMRNKKCQHAYEESAINAFIQKQRRKRRQAKCPVVGCDNVDIQEEDLEFDAVLFRTIKSRRCEETNS